METLFGAAEATAIRRLLEEGGPEAESRALGLIYRGIRSRIKRGRVFEPERALREGRADCLAYSRLLEAAALEFGLDVGVVEIIVDNAGRFVHHPANIFKSSDGRVRLVDLWYGSLDINHRRLCAFVEEGGRWSPKDLDRERLPEAGRVRGLPRRCLDAIAWYTYGNIHLNRKRFAEAIACYTRAVELYPENSRFYFNRALAYEGYGDHARAEEDRRRAFSREEALPRLLATEHEEVTRLILLDELAVPEEDQALYLLRHGYITGAPLSVEEIARRLGLAPGEVGVRLKSVEEKLKGCYHGEKSEGGKG